MAIMYPKNISEYMPTDSERIVYYELKNQLPDTFEVFYSVEWTTYKEGKLVKSEADFIVTSPDFGYICLEVKGGNKIYKDQNDNCWYLDDTIHGTRKLHMSPYKQAEKNMYFFKSYFSNKYNTSYRGIFGAGVVFPFYALGDDVVVDNRDRLCTIDCNDMNNLYDKIKALFKLWGGKSYGRIFYQQSQHFALMELIRERVAISAAAGALIKYKDAQLEVINRIQDNYVCFLKNIKQFYVKGGAGTGKTWIAMKMAKKANENGLKTLFLCSSNQLANAVKSYIPQVEVLHIHELFSKIISNFENFYGPFYKGISNSIKEEFPKYDAIYVDEAQDFTEEWALVVKKLLVDEKLSYFGIFYDDVQILREHSFGEGFGIVLPPFVLNENIRNTASIYKWATAKTNLGFETIANPVEGPVPVVEKMYDKKQLHNKLEYILKQYIIDERLSNDSVTILTDDVDAFFDQYSEGLAKWVFVDNSPQYDDEIKVASVEDFKGLESNMVIYIHKNDSSDNMNYVAYTRARFYLIELLIEF